MHIYPLFFQKLVENCSGNCFDSTIVQELKKQTLKGLETRFSPSAVHLVGLFFNPPYKEMFFLSEEKREQVGATVKAMIVDIQSKQSVQQSPENQAIVTNANAFSKFMDLNCSKKRKIEKNAEELEIDKYLAMTVSCDTNVLDFWKQNKSLKSLQALARNILNIPVSSATSERFFPRLALF